MSKAKGQGPKYSPFRPLMGEAKAGQAERTKPAAKPEPKSQRPVGRREDKENYTAVKAYLKIEVRTRVAELLPRDGRNFSELVEDLLSEWIKTKG